MKKALSILTIIMMLTCFAMPVAAVVEEQPERVYVNVLSIENPTEVFGGITPYYENCGPGPGRHGDEIIVGVPFYDWVNGKFQKCVDVWCKYCGGYMYTIYGL